MSVRAYLRSVAGGLGVHAGLMAVASAYMGLLGAGWPDLVTLWVIWLVVIGGYYGWRYASIRSYYRNLYLVGSLGEERPRRSCSRSGM